MPSSVATKKDKSITNKEVALPHGKTTSSILYNALITQLP